MKWVKPYVLNIIVAMTVSLHNEIEVTNRDINNKTIFEKRMVTTPLSQKCEDGHQNPSPEKNIRYKNYVITNIHMYI